MTNHSLPFKKNKNDQNILYRIPTIDDHYNGFSLFPSNQEWEKYNDGITDFP
jgi:hypothetical protein